MPGYFFFFGGYEATRGLLTPVGKTKDEIGMKLYIL
jgi:solute carrier family 25 ornithine transporter 2/15